jgi:hypothetical protein
LGWILVVRYLDRKEVAEQHRNKNLTEMEVADFQDRVYMCLMIAHVKEFFFKKRDSSANEVSIPFSFHPYPQHGMERQKPFANAGSSFLMCR